MSAKLCLYVRDSQHPVDLYDSTSHYYAVRILEAGSTTPLIWKGTNYNWVWLPFKGEFGRVGGEFEIPAGTYLVQAYASCFNVVTNLAWVQVNDGETASVNLVPTTVMYCLAAAQIGVALGTVKVGTKDTPIATVASAEVNAFEKAATALIEKLPKEIGIRLMSTNELLKLLREAPKE